jgi:hypothetical protein
LFGSAWVRIVEIAVVEVVSKRSRIGLDSSLDGMPMSRVRKDRSYLEKSAGAWRVAFNPARPGTRGWPAIRRHRFLA